MCIFKTPKPPAAVNTDAGRASSAAADALTRERRSAEGFQSTILGGLGTGNPAGSLARQMLLGN